MVHQLFQVMEVMALLHQLLGLQHHMLVVAEVDLIHLLLYLQEAQVEAVLAAHQVFLR